MSEKHPADGETRRPAIVVSLDGAAEPPVVPRQPRRERSVFDTPEFSRTLARELKRRRADELDVLEEMTVKVTLLARLIAEPGAP
ncbi:hypothetical protein [Streptomyces luteireticuli]|uniref:Uncharacterized protein n=1 Tax=Streptomyces luteireticuli TaxID=173858 RepID=A0ABN0Z3P1_9ACTN